MKKIVLLTTIVFSTFCAAQENTANNVKRDSDNFSPFHSYDDNVFKNNEANLEISKYYFDIKKYIKSKKQMLTSEDFENLMKQNKKDFTTINKAVDRMSAKLFLEKYSEDLEKYKKRIFEQVDVLAKN